MGLKELEPGNLNKIRPATVCVRWSRAPKVAPLDPASAPFRVALAGRVPPCTKIRATRLSLERRARIRQAAASVCGRSSASREGSGFGSFDRPATGEQCLRPLLPSGKRLSGTLTARTCRRRFQPRDVREPSRRGEGALQQRETAATTALASGRRRRSRRPSSSSDAPTRPA